MASRITNPAVTVLFLVAGLCLPAGPARAEGGGETPEAAFANVQTALADGDIAALLMHIAPSQRKGAALEMFVGATFAIAFHENSEMLDKGLGQILEKHDLSALLDDDSGPGLGADDDALQRAGEELFGGKDEVAFIRELFAFLADNQVMDLKQTADNSQPLADLEIDGDRASATWGGEPVLMLREGGRWYLDKAFGPGR